MEVHDLEEEEGTRQDRGGCVSQGVILHPQCGMHAATPRPGEGGGQSGFDALAGPWAHVDEPEASSMESREPREAPGAAAAPLPLLTTTHHFRLGPVNLVQL